MTQPDSEPELDPVEHIVVVGVGFIGLPLALLLSRHGKQVTGVDVDAQRVEEINNGSLETDDESISRLIEDEIDEENLIVQTNIPSADAFVISVPTPVT
jgi:UDP-N-acetyl-D-mannosaminuronic acid dehydrogenase